MRVDKFKIVEKKKTGEFYAAKIVSIVVKVKFQSQWKMDF